MFIIPIFKHNDIEINYFIKGKGEILLLIPGFSADYEMWNLQISYFRRKMMVLALDNRGAGKSSKPDYPYTMDMFTDDIYALLNHLNELGGNQTAGYILPDIPYPFL